MKKYLFAIPFAALVSTSALAHAPFLDCHHHGETIDCTGGFSDGSSGFGVEITVLNYDEEVLFEGRLDKESKISFDAPEGEYYVQFDGGPGHIIELDYLDIDEADDAANQ